MRVVAVWSRRRRSFAPLGVTRCDNRRAGRAQAIVQLARRVRSHCRVRKTDAPWFSTMRKCVCDDSSARAPLPRAHTTQRTHLREKSAKMRRVHPCSGECGECGRCVSPWEFARRGGLVLVAPAVAQLLKVVRLRHRVVVDDADARGRGEVEHALGVAHREPGDARAHAVGQPTRRYPRARALHRFGDAPLQREAPALGDGGGLLLRTQRARLEDRDERARQVEPPTAPKESTRRSKQCAGDGSDDEKRGRSGARAAERGGYGAARAAPHGAGA